MTKEEAESNAVLVERIQNLKERVKETEDRLETLTARLWYLAATVLSAVIGLIFQFLGG